MDTTATETVSPSCDEEYQAVNQTEDQSVVDAVVNEPQMSAVEADADAVDEKRGRKIKEWKKQAAQTQQIIIDQSNDRENEEYAVFLEFQVPLLLSLIDAAIKRGKTKVRYVRRSYLAENLPIEIHAKALAKYPEHFKRWLCENVEYDGLTMEVKVSYFFIDTYFIFRW